MILVVLLRALLLVVVAVGVGCKSADDVGDPPLPSPWVDANGCFDKSYNDGAGIVGDELAGRRVPPVHRDLIASFLGHEQESRVR